MLLLLWLEPDHELRCDILRCPYLQHLTRFEPMALSARLLIAFGQCEVTTIAIFFNSTADTRALWTISAVCGTRFQLARPPGTKWGPFKLSRKNASLLFSTGEVPSYVGHSMSEIDHLEKFERFFYFLFLIHLVPQGLEYVLDDGSVPEERDFFEA